MPADQGDSISTEFDAFPKYDNGSWFVWSVRSRTREKLHEVILNSHWDQSRNEFNGSCSCERFHYSLEGVFNGIGCVPKETRCHHINAAMYEFTRRWIIAAHKAQASE